MKTSMELQLGAVNREEPFGGQNRRTTHLALRHGDAFANTIEQSGLRCYTLFQSGPGLPMPTTKHRIAANLTDGEFSELAAMARKYDVSLAWIGRRAVLEFIGRYRTEQLSLPLRQESRRVAEIEEGNAEVAVPSDTRS